MSLERRHAIESQFVQAVCCATELLAKNIYDEGEWGRSVRQTVLWYHSALRSAHIENAAGSTGCEPDRECRCRES